MKKVILTLVAIFIASSAFCQFIMLEQDFRLPAKKEAIPFTQMLWDHTITGGLSLQPFIATTPGWNEALVYINYTMGAISFGLGAGVEQLEKQSFRFSPWLKFNPQIGSDSTKTLCLFSLWEVGNGQDNYWYTNSLTYETKKLSAGGLARRFYGVGPIFGYKVKGNNWNIKFSVAGPYDFEDETFKPTIILTLTN